ncbi:MAG TPA: hypothetical protein PK879_03485, partial [Opitutaceae bacterium]|nr:hypothetical protein [Opitutaceae bacterium]
MNVHLTKGCSPVTAIESGRFAIACCARSTRSTIVSVEFVIQNSSSHAAAKLISNGQRDATTVLTPCRNRLLVKPL